MALRETLTIKKQGFSGELSIADAYWKVVRVNGDKNQIDAEISVTADGAMVHTEFHRFVPDMSGKNFIAQTYEHLKTLPEFAGAQDC